MFLLSRPSVNAIESFLDARAEDTFSYTEVGYTRTPADLAGYNIDHNRQLLGSGPAVFERAKQAIREWRMFDFPWVRLYDPKTPIEEGRNVAIVIEHYGFHSLNASRIVYTLDEDMRFGFAYGTLTEHGEIGEERFSVEINDTGEVRYDLYAFSRPGSIWAKIGYPFARRLQKQFVVDSKAAMLEAVAGRKVEFPK